MDHRTLTLLTFEKMHAAHLVPPFGDVLDVGCRDNTLQKWFTQHGYTWHGCDKNTGFSLAEKRELGKEEWRRCEMENTPFKDESFDLLFVCHAFEHIENSSAALREFKRLLRPEGMIFISMPVHCEALITQGDHDHINILTPLQMQKLCAYNGLELVGSLRETNHEFPSGDYDNQIYGICKKKGVKKT